MKLEEITETIECVQTFRSSMNLCTLRPYGEITCDHYQLGSGKCEKRHFMENPMIEIKRYK